MGNIIAGLGLYLPKNCVTNNDLANSLDTSDEWIKARTGIEQRHIAEYGEYSSHMSYKAALEAIKDAGITSKDIDLIIVCTTTPDSTFPSTASKLQSYLGCTSTPTFDLQAVCAGFVYGLHVADCMMTAGNYNNVLLACVDKMSSIVDWSDRNTAVLFGDGAGAVVLKRHSASYGIIGSKIYSDGTKGDILYTDGGVGSTQQAGVVKMNGREVFKYAIENMAEAALSLLASLNMDINEVDHIVPHQANIRIIEGLAKYLKIDDGKIVKTVDKHANCSAASIPMALHSLKQSGRLKAGDVILTVAIGAGLAWGSNLIRWYQDDNHKGAHS